MHWGAKASILAGLAALCWGLGYVWAPFGFPPGELTLLLTWGLAPWWGLIPAVGFMGLLLSETFGVQCWPYAVTLVLCSGVALFVGPWWRAGRGPFRASVIAPLYLLGPWLLLRLILAYSPYPHDHLGWVPPGLVSMALIWGTMIVLRDYQPRRRPYHIGTGAQGMGVAR